MTGEPSMNVRLAEIGRMLGVSRTRAGQLAVLDPLFPRPVAVGIGVRLWDRAAVETYAKDRAERLAAKGTK